MSVSSSELLRAEDQGWAEVHSLMDALSAEQAERPGYFPEGWSAKDAIGHIGSWLAEAGMVLEQLAGGTYRPHEIDVDVMNERFLEAMRDVPFVDVKAQAHAARARMLQAWDNLGELSPEAAYWIRKSGADHYEEHLPRLREWVAEVRSGTPA
jgi:hypothetical protein